MADDGRPMGILRRSSEVVQLVAAKGPLSIAEVAEQVDMPRASVYRLTEALTQARLVEVGGDGRVRASLRCLRLSDATRGGLEEWAEARSVLDSLSDRTGQTTYLSVPVGDHALCIDWSRGRGISVLALKPGRTLPLYAGAAGRATLAFRAQPLEEYLHQAPFPLLTPHTLTTAEQLAHDVTSTRRLGHSVSDEDVTVGIGALGVPLLAPDGTLRGSLSLAGLATDIRGGQTDLVAALHASAAHLSVDA
ncbi:IclR family transcriptional regulator [uncultured Friedmanniella sp.]|uniref:IclR family transcriptional regulator n=1 Tax=uncultured Friedmanniella sp. TaxID=335381 RepID=UPI0035CC2231